MTSKVKIEIDGIPLEVDQGAMIIEAADDASIYIPRFCYHKKLSIAANCRMCLVEVDKSRKPLPACATPVTDGMKVFTRSPMALQSQKTVMEFLLINHPLDCPICDQGGECELQDLSVGFGQDRSPFQEGKRSVDDEDLGPFIATNMTRCIHCTRCVRFGTEIAGVRELGLTRRGEKAEITTYIEKTLSSELSANIIDLCPVGALTSKPYRYQARAWELQQSATIAPHDCVGSHISVHHRRNEVLRVVPKAHEAINENWLSDRDRFSYLGLYQDRVTQPMVRHHQNWEETDWSKAFHYLFQNMQERKANASENMLGLISSQSTLEEMYLFQKILRHLGCEHIDYRVRQQDFRLGSSTVAKPGLPIAISEIENQDAIFLIGSNIRHEQPLLSHRVRKAYLNGAKVFAVNPVDYEFNFELNARVTAPAYPISHHLAAIIQVLMQHGVVFGDEVKAFVGHYPVQIDSSHTDIATGLMRSNSKLLLLGAQSAYASDYSEIIVLARALAAGLNAQVGILSEGANASGAWISGALVHNSHHTGDHAPLVKFEQKHFKTIFLFNLEPEFDFANAGISEHALANADFVVAFSPFLSESLQRVAHVILPITPFTETAGTFVNIEQKWQSFDAVVHPLAESRPGWKVLRVLGNFLGLEGCQYSCTQEILVELESHTDSTKSSHSHLPFEQLKPLQVQTLRENELKKIIEWPIYRVDALARRSQAMQNAPANLQNGVYLNSAMAADLELSAGDIARVKQGEVEIELKTFIDERVPAQAILLPLSYPQTGTMGCQDVHVTVRKKYE